MGGANPPPSSPFSVASILYTIYFLSGKPEWFLHLKLYSKMENLYLVTVALIVNCVFFLKNTEFLEKMHFWPNWPDLDVVTSVYGYSRLFSIELPKKILVTRWSPRNAIFRDFLGPCLTAYVTCRLTCRWKSPRLHMFPICSLGVWRGN